MSSRHQQNKQNILLRISYDGTCFHGYQIQKKKKPERTVQGELEKALTKLLQHPVTTVAAGRTDSGVHADDQCVNFFTDTQIPDDRIHKALNSLLPRDIRAWSSTAVPASFSARYNACYRCYTYTIYLANSCPARLTNYVWPLSFTPVLDRLNNEANNICGTFDFAPFARANGSCINTVRHVQQATFTKGENTLRFTIVANAFLWRMVRSILGSLIQNEIWHIQGREGIPSMLDILHSKQRSLCGPPAPAQGLVLKEVGYDL